MAEFQGIFCHPFLLSVLIIEGWVGWVTGRSGVGRGGVGGWDGEGGGCGGRWQNPPLGTLHGQP